MEEGQVKEGGEGRKMEILGRQRWYTTRVGVWVAGLEAAASR